LSDIESTRLQALRQTIADCFPRDNDGCVTRTERRTDETAQLVQEKRRILIKLDNVTRMSSLARNSYRCGLQRRHITHKSPQPEF
jgi:hypothetical protein